MKYIIAAIMALTAFSSSAQDLPRYATVYDCAEWTRERQNKSGIGPESYVLGFLAAQAMEQLYTNKRDILSQHDYRALFSWVDNYCQAKPLDKLLIAAIALTTELTKRAIDQQQTPSRR
jgi:hypothetical protein